MVAPRRVPNLRLPQTDRPYRWSVVVSIAVHAALIFLFVGSEIRSRLAEDQALGSPDQPRGGGGGQTMRIEMTPYQSPDRPQAERVEKPPVPQVTVQPVPPPIKVQKLELPNQTGTVIASVDVSGLTAQGPGTGGGAGTGVGTGVGVDSGSGTGGEGGGIFPPTPRYTILPPPPPPSMRGRTLRVHFWVNAQGRVTRVQVEPEIKDAGYRQEFLSMMKEYTFNPARTPGGANIDGEMVMPVKF